MSSATSTEPQPLQPWQFFTLAGLVGATIVVFLSQGQSPAGIILLSVIIFGAAAVGVAAWRTFSPLSSRDEPAAPQMFGGRTRAALWREKTLVLRSIKDLEFDHAMGKVSDKDFAEMGARLRARAAGLMRQLDAGSSYRDAIEAEIAKRIGAPPAGRTLEGPPPQETAAARTVPAPSADRAERILSGPRTAIFCSSCGKENAVDARFCSNCGTKLVSQ